MKRQKSLCCFQRLTCYTVSHSGSALGEREADEPPDGAEVGDAEDEEDEDEGDGHLAAEHDELSDDMGEEHLRGQHTRDPGAIQ